MFCTIRFCAPPPMFSTWREESTARSPHRCGSTRSRRWASSLWSAAAQPRRRRRHPSDAPTASIRRKRGRPCWADDRSQNVAHMFGYCKMCTRSTMRIDRLPWIKCIAHIKWSYPCSTLPCVLMYYHVSFELIISVIDILPWWWKSTETLLVHFRGTFRLI